MPFSKDFLWGAASAAHQIEGAYLEDGKSPGIWDALHKGHVKHNENGNVACDHYHRYREDVALMKQLGLKSYRFSISWPRIMPEEGAVNEAGLDFYRNLVSALREANIEPIVTLYHWNLPMWLHEKGGWENPSIVEYFREYTQVVVEHLSDQVRYWITINEPQCIVSLGYEHGVHAPFLKKPEAIPTITRNILLAHGAAVRAIRQYAFLPPLVGMAPTGTVVTPYDSSEEQVAWAKEKTFSTFLGCSGNVWWADPAVLGRAPEPLAGVLSKEDLKKIHEPLDFYGFNSYYSLNFLGFEGINDPREYSGMPRTALGWPITPECLYWMPHFLFERYQLPILITENGMANLDFPMSDGKVHDPQRIDYIRRYLKELKRAMEEGVPVIGYQYWSILDNYEWAEGYDPRFGLIYVDYETQKRIPKDSAFFYAEVIRTNGENIEN